jgi:taurine dioxygenase
MHIFPSGQTLGARIEGIDLQKPLSKADIRTLLLALGQHGVLCFPRQTLDVDAFAAFGHCFGGLEINVANMFHEPNHPEVMILSNIKKDGKSIGLGDAGQGWHTDMSYSELIALSTILHAQQVPLRDGQPVGNTEFRNMHAAYEGLPADIKARIEGRTATHDFNKFWEMMRARPGNTRPPLTEAQRKRKPPVSHPIAYTHPITGKKVLYCTIGYVTHIDGMDPKESAELLDFLYKHQDRDEYLYAHRWTQGDVLMWDNIGTTHNAIPDYGDIPRYMRRVQVLADLDYPAMVA